MSEDRYEIRSKIGEGGVGAVYRAFDKHLNREVALKRVLAGGEGEDREDATGQMLKEAAALCSLQHPHIVTVYDSGQDKDGPYVVMELLSGRTIDEMVERGILTYDDFREVALQSQEALIAAQDLDLVHRDIKPSNLMITWLPSGRFHTKLVDFGLAKFQPMPSHQTVDHGDSVFGSIRFMAPEQFERIPLDKRTDMYSMGCVYYYCLSGQYPFDGETAPQVMNAHLQNQVIPLAEIRPDLPVWLCDWVMWHMSRNMADRPVDARNSLTQFLMSENGSNPANNNGSQPTAGVAVQPNIQLTNPDGGNGPLRNNTAPQPIQPPEGHSPSVHTAAQNVQPKAAAQPRLVIPTAAAAPAQPETAPQQVAPAQVQGNTSAVQSVSPVAPAPAAAAPPAVAVPQVTVPLAAAQTAPVAAQANPLLVAGAGTAPPAAAFATPPQQQVQPTPEQPQAAGVGIGSVTPQAKKGLSNTVKVMIATTLLAALIVAAIVFKGNSDRNDDVDRLNEITGYFSDPKNIPDEIPLSESDVSLLLSEINKVTTKDGNEREAYMRALGIGKASDGANISEKIAVFAKETELEPALRSKLFMIVGRRGDPAALPALIGYASSTDDTTSGQAALMAAKEMATTSNFQSLLSIITNSSNGSLKSSAVIVLSKVIAESDDPSSFATPIISTFKSVSDLDSSAALLRLMGSAGGDEAASLVSESLKKDDARMKIAAIYALRYWPDDSEFETLLEYTKGEDNDRLRKEAFNSLVTFLKDCPNVHDDDKSIYWNDVAVIATGEVEQRFVVSSMAEQDGSWADDILDYFLENADSDRVNQMAERAKERLADRIRRAERSGSGSSKDGEDEDE